MKEIEKLRAIMTKAFDVYSSAKDEESADIAYKIWWKARDSYEFAYNENLKKRENRT